MIPAQGALVRPLALKDPPQLINYLTRDSVANIYPLGWVATHGISPSNSNLSFQFIGAFNEEQLTGMMLLAGQSLLFMATDTPQAAREFIRHLVCRNLQFKVIIGLRESLENAIESLSALSIKPRLSRPQLLLVLYPERFRPVTSSGLRRASLQNLETLLAATMDMYSQEIRAEPAAADIPAFRRTLQHQILQGNVYCSPNATSNQIEFKANVTARSRYGTQIEGVYVPPHLRRRGFATRGMSQLCLKLLEEAPPVSLFVNRDNSPARSLYEQKLGFQPTHDFTTAFF